MGTSNADGPVAKMTGVVPVALMGWVAWAKGRITVRVTVVSVWLYAVKVPPVNPGVVV